MIACLFAASSCEWVLIRTCVVFLVLCVNVSAQVSENSRDMVALICALGECAWLYSFVVSDACVSGCSVLRSLKASEWASVSEGVSGRQGASP